MTLNATIRYGALVAAAAGLLFAPLSSGGDVASATETATETTATETAETETATETTATGTAEAVEDGAPTEVHSTHEHEHEHEDADQSDHRSGWTPGADDTCSTEAHEQFTVTGADGNLYDGWHPTVVIDPVTGKECSFGHEHGDDPASSDIYDFAASHFSDGSGIPFGAVNAASEEYAEATSGAVAHRHEDHYGQKVFVANDVQLVREDRSGYVTDANGEPLVCDYLIGFHQGTHSADALSNNAHQITYASSCSDGSEVAVQALTRLGDPNEFTEKCTGNTVATSGSSLEGSDRGARIIPDVDCVVTTQQTGANSANFWALYEVWQTDTTIEMPGGGTIRFDPWFGVRNPSRVAEVEGTVASAIATVSFAGEQTNSYPWAGVDGSLEQNALESPFNGAERDFYLQNTTVDLDGGSMAGVFYTDPYGENPSSEPFPGSVAQYVNAADNTDLAAIERWNSGFSTDYGSEAESVHAPN